MEEELKNLILIENEEIETFDTKEELIKCLLGEDFYALSKENKKEIINEKVIANQIGKKDIKTIEIKDETMYIYWLLKNTNILLLEKTSSNIFTKELDKTNISKNYVVVNNFVEELKTIYEKELKENE